ncbi:MAG: TraR/DksA family transcriptional regulator [Halobacteriovoraceae bacterium]|nr:TraR/DksA family transcriptional regulator [Halobacteriovoraceae bacterium]MCB9093926.1 TraR/DksA family transcriptional regulator [Halobacteriovoraceae bacterium]
MPTEQTEHFKQKLLDLRGELLQRVENLDADKKRKYGALNADFEEQASQLENDEVVDALDDMERSELSQINRALVKIQQNKYGTCENCGTTISEKRLEALPYASKCIKCSSSDED